VVLKLFYADGMATRLEACWIRKPPTRAAIIALIIGWPAITCGRGRGRQFRSLGFTEQPRRQRRLHPHWRAERSWQRHAGDRGGVTGGIASSVLTVGAGLQPTGETDLGGGTPNPPRGNGFYGDASDNLVVDFGFAQTTDFLSIGHRVFNDNGAGWRHGQQRYPGRHRTGIAGVVVKLFADDGSGNPTGTALDTQTTDASGYYRFDGLAPEHTWWWTRPIRRPDHLSEQPGLSQ